VPLYDAVNACSLPFSTVPPCVLPQDARDFGRDGYSLRLQQQGADVRLLICVTLYNEDAETLNKTLIGVCEVGDVMRVSLSGVNAHVLGGHWLL
jgi:hypothetical protein